MTYRILTPISCVAFALVAGVAQAAPATPAAAVRELLEADRQFSADAAGENIVDGIAAMLAPDAIAPTPFGTFVKGKAAVVDLLRSNPANATATAEWAPVRGGIAADGVDGFTYGFMIIHIPGEADRRAKYLAYWTKRPEGWRVLTYKRFGSPPGAVSTNVRAPALPPRMLPDRPSLSLRNKYKNSLAARETAFSDRAQDVGLQQAFVEFGSADAMNMTMGGSDFVYGNTAIGAGLPPGSTSPVHWAADEQVTVASTGDLGVTFGYIRPNVPEPGQPPTAFFTVWRRASPDSPWLYVAE